MRISDWSSDVCSSDLRSAAAADLQRPGGPVDAIGWDKFNQIVNTPPVDEAHTGAEMRVHGLAVGALLLFALAPAGAAAEACDNVGAWNIEHFNDGASRGFPEQPGALGPHGPAEFVLLAVTNRKVVKASILALSEINGVPGEIGRAHV